VDLAGSERISLTGTKGLAAKESIDINKSLFVLRKVIMSLSDSKKSSKDKSHIPYRDSKLTSLLKQSIGGNSYCLMIACIAPSDRFTEENISTLNYATRASNIKNAPTKNIDPKIREINELKKKNKALQLELRNANSHIEYLTSLTQEELQTFGTNLIPDNLPGSSGRLTKPDKLESLSPVKSRGNGVQAIAPTMPMLESKSQATFTSIGTSIGGSIPTSHMTTGGITTHTEKISSNKKKGKKRNKSKDFLAKVEKRESIDEIAKRKQFEDKMHMITSEIKGMNMNRDNTNTNFKDAMTRVTDLLKVNQMLRDETNSKEEIIKHKNVEIFQIKDENEELRDKLELMETIVSANRDTYNEYVASHLSQQAEKGMSEEYMGLEEGKVQIDSVYVELLELRNIVKKLETRNKFLEKQNMENQYQMHFIGNNEPSRPIMKQGGSGKKKASGAMPKLIKNNSVPAFIEPKNPYGGSKPKKNKTKKVSSYKGMTDEDFFASSALMRNGDYAMSKDSWQKVELNYKKNHLQSPVIALSSSGFSSERDPK